MRGAKREVRRGYSARERAKRHAIVGYKQIPRSLPTILNERAVVLKSPRRARSARRHAPPHAKKQSIVRSASTAAYVITSDYREV